MYCQNCGTKLNENDRFCGKCGTSAGSSPASSINILKESFENAANFIKAKDNNSINVMTLFVTYVKKPITIFEELKEKDVYRASVITAILMPIIYGILSILFVSEFVNGFIKILKDLPNKMVDLGFMSKTEATMANVQMQSSGEFLMITAQLKAFIDNTEVFKYSSLCLLVLIVFTFVLVTIVNILFLNKELNYKSIVFIVTISYLPLILTFTLQLIVGLLSLKLSLMMIPVGFVLSMITLYKGLCQYSSISKDKIFLYLGSLIIALFIVMALVTDGLANAYIKNLITDNLLKSFMEDIF